MVVRLLRRSALIIFIGLLVISNPLFVYAEQLQSPSYVLDESTIGTSDMSQSSSTNYTGTNATGALSVGTATSNSYNISTGTKTTPDPALTFSMDDYSADFGSFSATIPTTTTTTFSVTNYTSYGYVAQIVGKAPSNGTHTITAMANTGLSITGTEQFGINLVANTAPTAFGANLDNYQFGFGQIAPNYSTTNQYRYVSGETIALAPKSSGKTTYTISYLVNVSSITPGGQYASDQVIIVTGTY